MTERRRGVGGRFLGRFDAEPTLCPCGNQCLHKRVICEVCRADPVLKARAKWKIDIARRVAKVNDNAEQETRRLKRADAFTPLDGEAIVNRWLRGEE